MDCNSYRINSENNKLASIQNLSKQEKKTSRYIEGYSVLSISNMAISIISFIGATVAVCVSAPIAAPVVLVVSGIGFGICAIICYVALKRLQGKLEEISKQQLKEEEKPIQTKKLVEETGENGFTSEKEALLTSVNQITTPQLLEELKVQYAKVLDDELEYLRGELVEANKANNQEKIDYYRPLVENHPRNTIEVNLEKRRLESQTQA